MNKMNGLLVFTSLLILGCSHYSGRKPTAYTPSEKEKIKAKIRSFNEKIKVKYKTAKLYLDVPYFEIDAEDITQTKNESIKLAKIELDAIANLQDNEITFETTFQKMDDLEDRFFGNLSRISFLSSVSKNEELREAAKKVEVEMESFMI